uniref:Uncharacterized protein n=1 Tax=Arion vulgaris TaxID=1028688 RepID=A0A0B6ZZU4_9EUPU
MSTSNKEYQSTYYTGACSLFNTRWPATANKVDQFAEHNYNSVKTLNLFFVYAIPDCTSRNIR